MPNFVIHDGVEYFGLSHGAMRESTYHPFRGQLILSKIYTYVFASK